MACANGLNNNTECTTELKAKIDEWLAWDKNSLTRDEIQSLAKQHDWTTLKTLLLKRLAFGTAGLRGVMRGGFASMNDLVVIQTAQGMAKYILKCFPTAEERVNGVVFGYDGRHNSKRFAELSACVFLNEGIPVWLYSRMVPTPFVPFAIAEKRLLAGVMVTASHNPKEDNGYKVYWNNGAQIIPPHDKNIQQSILENLKPLPSSWNLDSLASPLLKDPYEAMDGLYYEKLLQNIPSELISDSNLNSDLRFVYSAMHGVGYDYVEKAFEAAKLRPLVPVPEQQYPDPDFPTVKFPNPEEGKSSLVLSFALAKQTECTIILANDPDADRLACAEFDTTTEQWKVFTGNELGALLGWWSVECFKRQHPTKSLDDCYMLASTVSSKILRAMGRIEGFHFIETLTGFKWMGNRTVDLLAENKTVLFAFEEAIGFMFSPTVLDKDGVSSACHLATLAAHLKHDGRTLGQLLNDLYRKYGYHFTHNSYYLCYEPVTIEKIFERIRNFKQQPDSYPDAVLDGKYPIASVRDLTTGVDTAQPDGRALLPASKSSQMITFSFENGVVITLRTSGTEPKIKYYAEMCAKPEEKNWESLRTTLKEMIDATVLELLEPEKNKIIPQSQ